MGHWRPHKPWQARALVLALAQLPPRLSSAPANLRCSAGRFNAKPLCVSSTLLARSRSWSPAGQRGPRASSPGCAVPSQLYLLGCAAPCHALCAVPCCSVLCNSQIQEARGPLLCHLLEGL